jgi:hypothetical protein
MCTTLSESEVRDISATSVYQGLKYGIANQFFTDIYWFQIMAKFALMILSCGIYSLYRVLL